MRIKTKADVTIPYVIIGYSCCFTIPLLITYGFALTNFGWLWIGMWSLVALYGIWRIENYQLNDNVLIKKNFLGVFSRERNLHSLIKYTKRNINTDFPSNPLNIVRLFTNRNKYLKFQRLKLEFKGKAALRIDEMTVDSKDYSLFYRELKKKLKQVRKRKYRADIA
ncbi:hypothetical protein [Catalinimonas alkaloidigena]|uniref:hypothetical protein n=1 Tax=Catalinimonas alkaloidigena TaxID=1075417 RepID=UPI000B7E8540|nr:hypothetical protein [Catalinimonas alkaloidigena]